MTTTKEISDNLIVQLEATFGSSMPKSFSRVLAKVLAGVFIILYKYCGFIFLQLFVSTASMRPTEINGKTVTPLIEWGRLIGAGDPFPATQAELVVRVTAEILGTTLPAATQIVSVASGVTYITMQAVTLDTALTDIGVVAVSDQSGGGGAGTIGNLEPGAALSFANPLSGVARGISVVSQAVTGTDAETDDQYRTRVISRFQLRPQGGAYVDYKLWAESTHGVLQAYPYTSSTPGQVNVYIESSTEPDGIPTTAQLEAALESIKYDNSTGLATRRPAGALVNTLAIIRVPFSVEIVGLSVENPVIVKANIEAALNAYFLERSPYLVGLTLPPRLDRITESAVSGIVEDVVSLANGIFTEAKLYKSAVLTPIYTLGIGEKAKLTGVTYT